MYLHFKYINIHNVVDEELYVLTLIYFGIEVILKYTEMDTSVNCFPDMLALNKQCIPLALPWPSSSLILLTTGCVTVGMGPVKKIKVSYY